MRHGISTKTTAATILIGVAVLLLGGCIAPKAFKADNAASLKPGMSKSEVQAKMGKPMGTSTKGATETWTYDWHDPITSRYKRVELLFENGVYKEMTTSTPEN